MLIDDVRRVLTSAGFNECVVDASSPLRVLETGFALVLYNEDRSVRIEHKLPSDRVLGKSMDEEAIHQTLADYGNAVLQGLGGRPEYLRYTVALHYAGSVPAVPQPHISLFPREDILGASRVD